MPIVFSRKYTITLSQRGAEEDVSKIFIINILYHEEKNALMNVIMWFENKQKPK